MDNQQSNQDGIEQDKDGEQSRSNEFLPSKSASREQKLGSEKAEENPEEEQSQLCPSNDPSGPGVSDNDIELEEQAEISDDNQKQQNQQITLTVSGQSCNPQDQDHAQSIEVHSKRSKERKPPVKK